MADDRRRDDARPGDPAEGVRIIGAEEAAEAMERGDVAERRGTHLPRYGDRPSRPPAGPKPALRFPLAADDDAETPSLRPAKGKRFDPRPPPAWDEPEVADTDEGDPWPAESTWGEAAWDEDPQADVVAWTRGETGAQPVVPSAATPAEPGLAWAEDFVDEDDPWDGSWDEPTGAVRWADDQVQTAAAGAPPAEAPAVDPPAAVSPDAPVTSGDAPPDDDWAAFGAAEEEEPRRGRGLFSRRRGGESEPAEAEHEHDVPQPDVPPPGAPRPDAAPVAPAPADVPAPSAEVDPPAVDASVWAPPEPTEEPTIDDHDADHQTETHTAIDEAADDGAEAEPPAPDEGLAAWGEP
ncbi:MAG TPA: hypothetical protein VGO60_08005, partial [Iamia sp.]|nr:hypothetical protein [Iamia sp.]